MITRIEIDGFKAFRRFALDLEPLQIIAGANSAGKSNLFDALSLLGRLADSSVADAFAKGRGRIDDQFTRQPDGPVKTISLAVELLLHADPDRGAKNGTALSHTRIRYDVGIERRELDRGGEEISVFTEVMRPITQEADAWAARHPELAKFYLYGEKDPFLTLGRLDVEVPRDDGTPVIEPYHGPGGTVRDRSLGHIAFSQRDRVDSTILRTHGHSFGPHVTAVRRELLGFRFPLVDLMKMRQPSERAASKVVAGDGSNVPTVLASLPPARMAHIRADLADLVPGVRSIDAVSERDEFWVEVEFTDGQRLPARVLSDGTLRLLLLSTLIRSSLPGTVIAYEEPENGIFPGRLRELLEKLIAVTTVSDMLPVQVLLNTHAPVVLSVLHDRPRAIVLADLVRQPDGLRMTRMRHVAEGASEDRGATTVSHREIERILEMARPEEAE